MRNAAKNREVPGDQRKSFPIRKAAKNREVPGDQRKSFPIRKAAKNREVPGDSGNRFQSGKRPRIGRFQETVEIVSNQESGQE